MFFHSNTLILSKQDPQRPLSVKWITLSKLWSQQKDSRLKCVRENYYYGSYDMFPCSLDWLGVFSVSLIIFIKKQIFAQGKSLKLIQISGLRNQGNNSKLTILKEFQNLEILKMIREVLSMELKERNQNSYLEMVFRDFKNCLMKICLNIVICFIKKIKIFS